MSLFFKKISSFLIAILIILTSCTISSYAEDGFVLNLKNENIVQLKPVVSVGEEYGYGFSLFNNVSYSGCYGNQLSGDSKGIYDAFKESYSVNRAADSVTYALSEEYSFKTSYIVDENGVGSVVANDEYNDTVSEITAISQIAMDAFLYDHPEVFWMNAMSLGLNMSIFGETADDVTCIVTDIIFNPSETYSGSSLNISLFDSNVSSVVADIKSNTAKKTSRREVLKYIHDYICKNAYYDSSNTNTAHTAEPFFIWDGGVVCEGYSKTFKIICDRLNIPCACVSGFADTQTNTEGHMWNYVMLEDSRWYLIDITWDDQTIGIYDTYFLANWNTQGFYERVSDERCEIGDFSGTGYNTFVYPNLCYSDFPITEDMIIIRNLLMKNTVNYDITMDFNGDSILDTRDIVRVKRVLAGIDFS